MKRLTKESISWVSILILAFLLTACRMRALEGTVVGINGEPLSGSIVTLEIGTNGGLQQSRKTDDAGKFSFGSIATIGGCAIRAEKAGYDTKKIECATDGKPLRVQLQVHAAVSK
jgi:hypothetical protein